MSCIAVVVLTILTISCGVIKNGDSTEVRETPENRAGQTLF